MKQFLQRLKDGWEGFIRRIGSANRETFGAGGPGCCNPDAKRPAKKSAP